MSDEYDHCKALLEQWRSMPDEPSMTLPPGVPNVIDVLQGTARPMTSITDVAVEQEFTSRIYTALCEHGSALRGMERASPAVTSFLTMQDNAIAYVASNLSPMTTIAFGLKLIGQSDFPSLDPDLPGWVGYKDAFR